MPGPQKVTVMLRNVTNNVITLNKSKIIAELASANLIPNKIVPHFVIDKKDPTFVKSGQTQVRNEKRIEKLMSKLELSGMKTWNKECQEKAE